MLTGFRSSQRIRQRTYQLSLFRRSGMGTRYLSPSNESHRKRQAVSARKESKCCKQKRKQGRKPECQSRNRRTVQKKMQRPSYPTCKDFPRRMQLALKRTLYHLQTVSQFRRTGDCKGITIHSRLRFGCRSWRTTIANQKLPSLGQPTIVAFFRKSKAA